MSLAKAARLLRCPACRGVLELRDQTLRCGQDHSFDLARQGYVNLLGGAEPANADTSTMLQARARVHASGVFEKIIQAVASLTHGRPVVLEVGAGTGQYLASVMGDDPEAVGIALDVSKAAARHCARADRRIAAVVADVWEPLPIQDHCLDTVLAVFAPRNLPEFARILRTDGRFIAVTPRAGHLADLRQAHQLLDVPAGKADQLTAAAAEFFDLVDTRVLKYRLPVDESLAADLIAMGPNAFHQVPQNIAASVISVDVTVQSFRPLLP